MKIPEANVWLTEMQFKMCEEYIANGGNKTDAMRKAGYSERSCKCNAGKVFDADNVRDYLKWRKFEITTKMRDKLDKQYPYKQIQSTYDYKTNLLYGIAENNEDDRIKISAVVELNKMEGHYAPEKSVNVNLGVDANIEEVKRVTSELLEKNKREY